VKVVLSPRIVLPRTPRPRGRPTFALDLSTLPHNYWLCKNKQRESFLLGSAAQMQRRRLLSGIPVGYEAHQSSLPTVS
jgi:hypothetical protein